MIDIFNLYENLKEDGVIFCFSGSTSQSIIEGIGGALRQKMELEGAGPSVINRVFAVFIEQIHNILHYSEEKVTQEPRARRGIALWDCPCGNVGVPVLCAVRKLHFKYQCRLPIRVPVATERDG